MENPYIGNAATFLVSTVLGLYTLVILLRLLLQLVRADFYNPISQFIVKISNPPLRPLRKIIPGVFGIDSASIILTLGLKALELLIIISLNNGPITSSGIAVLTIAETLGLVINVFLFAIFIQVIISWVNPGTNSPFSSLLSSLTSLILRPTRRIIKPVGMLDLSPMAAIVFLYLLTMLIVAPLRDFGRHLLFS